MIIERSTDQRGLLVLARPLVLAKFSRTASRQFLLTQEPVWPRCVPMRLGQAVRQ